MSDVPSSLDLVAAIFAQAAVQEELFVDIESNHPRIHEPDWEFWGVGIAAGPHAAYITDLETAKLVTELIWSFSGDIVGHNPKFDLNGLKKQFNKTDFPKKIVCTLIAMNLIDESIPPRELGLKPLVLKLFGHTMMTYEEAMAFGRDSKEFAAYCMEDCIYDQKLWHWEKERLEKDNLVPVFRRILMECVKVVCDMEIYGFGWDLPTAQQKILAFKEVEMRLIEEIRAVLGPEWKTSAPADRKEPWKNLNSGEQLAEKLYGEMKVSTKGIQKTKSGSRFQLTEKEFELLAPKYPVMRLLRDWKFAQGMISKYLFKICDFAMKDPHCRTHAETWLSSTTGRTRQTDPPNQTIPKYPPLLFQDEKSKGQFAEKFRLRSPFRARPGYQFLIADFAGCQLRLCAHVSKDKRMTEAFCRYRCTACGTSGSHERLLLKCPSCGALPNEKILKDPTIKAFWHGDDLHQQTMDNVNSFIGKPILESRQDGKTANFALIFLASEYRMHQEHPKYSVDMWRRIIDGFFNEKTGYFGVKRYHIRLEQLLDSTGVVSDIFGRKRRISKEEIWKHRKHALNMFVNFPIQSSEVGYAELSMVKIREQLISEGIWNDGRFTNHGACIAHFMHDEIVVEAPDEVVPHVADVMLNHMRYLVQLSVPMDAELKIKGYW